MTYVLKLNEQSLFYMRDSLEKDDEGTDRLVVAAALELIMRLRP